MATPNFSPRVTDEDIEAQPQDEFTYGISRACAEQCAGKSIWVLIRVFLIHVVGKSHAKSSARLRLMYLSENEKQGGEISEGRKDPKGDRDDVLMFVSPGILSSLYSPSYVPRADWSLLDYSRDFPRGKLPIAITGLEHHDSSIAHTIGSTTR